MGNQTHGQFSGVTRVVVDEAMMKSFFSDRGNSLGKYASVYRRRLGRWAWFYQRWIRFQPFWVRAYWAARPNLFPRKVVAEFLKLEAEGVEV